MSEDKSQIVIAVTHDGVFHSDEVLACALLRIAAGPFGVAVTRSRLPKDWERADYVIDVGGKHDGIKWFDHHQIQGAGQRENGIPYSAFGLVWNALGVTAVRQLLKEYIDQKIIDEADVQEVVSDLESFVSSIDAHDQAVLSTVSRFTKDRSVTVEGINLPQVISNYNPIALLHDYSESLSNKQFYRALDFAEEWLRNFMERKASRVLSERYVQKYDTGDAVLVLPRFCEWQRPVGKMEHVIYVVYPSVNGKSYTVQCTKKSGGQGSTDNLRLPFPKAWGGVSEGELRRLSGVPDAVFCHRDRFIAAALTLQGAITLAKKSIEENANSKSN